MQILIFSKCEQKNLPNQKYIGQTHLNGHELLKSACSLRSCFSYYKDAQFFIAQNISLLNLVSRILTPFKFKISRYSRTSKSYIRGSQVDVKTIYALTKVRIKGRFKTPSDDFCNSWQLALCERFYLHVNAAISGHMYIKNQIILLLSPIKLCRLLRKL